MAATKLMTALLLLLFMILPAYATSPQTPNKERCPVCGMFVAPYPSWLAVVQFKDQSMAYFDGPKDMFVYLSDIGRYNPGAKTEDISGVFVSDYYNVERIPAKDAYFVSGSDVLGPMGDEYVPLVSQEQVKTFMRDHGGKSVYKMQDYRLIETKIE